MAVDHSFMIRKIKSKTKMYVAYCAYTNMPLVECDPETGNDRIFIFEKEPLLQEFAKPYTERKILLRGVEVKNKAFLKFYSSLFAIGVNELVYVNEGSQIILALDDLVRRPDLSALSPEQRPVMNESLQLTGMYFKQEAGRPVPAEEKEDLEDLQEELTANMLKGTYILAYQMQEGPGTVEEKIKAHKYNILLIKDKEGNTYQPAFTDPFELEKFSKGKPFTALRVPFADLTKCLVKEAQGFMLNPAGFQILMPRQLLEELPTRFQ